MVKCPPTEFAISKPFLDERVALVVVWYPAFLQRPDLGAQRVEQRGEVLCRFGEAGREGQCLDIRRAWRE